MLKRAFLGALVAAFAFAATSVRADENNVKKAVEAFLGKGNKVESVRKAGVMGLYEVQVGGELFYTDEKVSHLLLGDLVDVKTKRNLTEERKAKLSQIKFSDLPLEMAIKQVRGNGKRVIATFEDPNCGYCKKLAKELVGMTDITIYVFPYPILSPNSMEKSKAIWCASDRAKAWNNWMVEGIEPSSAKCDAASVDKVVDLGRKLNIRGTPTIFFADGSRVPGYMPAAQLEQTLSKIAN